MTPSQDCDLIRRKFKALNSLKDVAEILGVSEHALRYQLYASKARSTRYIHFEIKKKSGGVRQISAPVGLLKTIQAHLNAVLQCVYEPKAVVHGFTPDKSIVSNAIPHIRRRWVLNVDILDFFPSINFGRVRGMFMASPYNISPRVSTILAGICCTGNQLPQGAPTSPIVANMLCARMDHHLSQLAATNRCIYSRYADDLSFSTHQSVFPRQLAVQKLVDGRLLWVPGTKLNRTIKKNGFDINQKKVRLQKYNQRQEVTGLIVNKKPNIPRRFIREIRATLNNIRKEGVAKAHLEYVTKYAARRQRHPTRVVPHLSLVIRGKIEYVGMVRGNEDDLYYRFLRELDTAIPGFVRLPVRKSQLELVSEHMWVIETDENQGSGFLLAGHGLVTANHILVNSSTITATSKDGTTYEAKVIAQDATLDLAILDIGFDKEVGLQKSLQEASLRTRIILMGFPNHNLGDSVQIREGHISGSRKDPTSGDKLLLLNAPILFGNSGGPVLDHDFRVMGIALRGAADETKAQSTEFHAARPISDISRLQS